MLTTRRLSFMLAAILALLPVPSRAVTGTVAPFPKHQFFNNNGTPCVGCKLFSYSAGTSTKVSTYSDAALSSANTNPVVLDASGRATLFLTPGLSYKFILAPSTDTDPPVSPIWTIDSVQSVPPTGTATDLDVTGTAGENLAAGEVVYLTDGSGGTTAGRWYRADADAVASSTGAYQLGIVPSSITTSSSGSVRISGRITGLTSLTAGALYYISSTAGGLTSTAPTNARPVGVADSTTTLVISPWALGLMAGTGTPGLVSSIAQNFSGVKSFVSGPPTFAPGSAASVDGTMSGAIYRDSVQHANTAVTTEVTLSTYSLPANALDTNGKAIRIVAWGTCPSNADTKRVRLKFGATTFTVTNCTANQVNVWKVEAVIMRRSATTQTAYYAYHVEAPAGTATALVTLANPTETLSGAITITTTGQSASGGLANDVVQEAFFVEAIG